MNGTVFIIVSSVLGTFLLISCFLVLCFYLRWKKAKSERSNGHPMEPPFFFRPETPVFLIGRQEGGKRSALKKKSERINEHGSIDSRVTASDTNLYSSERREPKKVGSIRQLYASIGRSFY